MSFKQVVLSLVLFCCCATASAEITLKKNFFTGWKFSTDGTKYQKVGFSGTKLYDAMVGNEAAQKRMKSYKTAKTWSAITGIPGGALIGWPIGGYIGGGEWKDGYTEMIIVGGALAVISTIFETTATSNLKKAVKIYNEGNTSVSFKLDYKKNENTGRQFMFAAVTYEF